MDNHSSTLQRVACVIGTLAGWRIGKHFGKAPRCARGLLGCALLALATQAQGAQVIFTTTATASDTGFPSDGMVDSSAMVAGDKYLISFTLDDSVLCYSVLNQPGGRGGLWLNTVISFTLTALPGNTGTYNPGSFTIASSYVQIEQPNNTRVRPSRSLWVGWREQYWLYLHRLELPR